jgi:pyruvate/2-oxoglutarate dehydrogenase complex dihydrolipoamide dehydrogenase (E3) component
MGARAADLRRAVWVHPTLAESFLEAAGELP